MTLARFLVLACSLSCAAAFAQLKLPRGGDPTLPSRPAAATAPASAQPQAAVAAPAVAADKEAADKEAAAKLAAAGWLTLLDRRDWGTAWETSAGMFRSAVPLPAWMDGIAPVRAPLGALVERVPAEAVYKKELPGKPAGDYVSVLFLSKFDKQELQEIVTTVREPDGKWRVTGYSTR